MKINKFRSSLIAGLLVLLFNSCNAAETNTGVPAATSGAGTAVAQMSSVSEIGSALDTTEFFTNRDLKQEVNFSKAIELALRSNAEVVVQEEGIYILSGNFTDTAVIVEAGEEDKIQFVLDNLSISNKSVPAIYVKSADKVYVTTTDSQNSLQVTQNYAPDGGTNLDAVIFSRSDLVLNGTGTLEIVSAKGNGVSSKDDLKITGGTLKITAYADGLEANDSICVYDGKIVVQSREDGLHSENEEDPLSGYIYIRNGVINIAAGDDAIRGNSVVQIDGGDINIETCQEGVEATSIQINGGDLVIYATDDGINAAAKTRSMNVAVEINGGNIDVSMANGDTDALDSNGDFTINGGTINVVTPRSSFDVNGQALLLGGNLTVNGQAVTEITAQRGGGRRGRHW